MTQDLIERDILRGLTKAQRHAVSAGYICDERMTTVQNLKRKGLFYLKIDSPNGRCGTMELTPLGKRVQSLIRAHREGEAR